MYCWPRCTDSSSSNAAFALRLPALHGASGGATMTIPGGTRTTLWTARVQFPTRARPTSFYHGVGAPTGPLYGALALRSAHPDAAGVVICTLGPRTPNSVLYPSGAPGPIRAARGGLHGVVNFAFTEFSEVRSS